LKVTLDQPAPLPGASSFAAIVVSVLTLEPV
jgi:hypothetical protein